jgi:hypothetical protein
MTHASPLELMHAEIDGELNWHQKGELAQLVLADAQARAEREGLRRVCAALDALTAVEPPGDLRSSILAALPQVASPRVRSAAFVPDWRIAAAVAAVLIAGAVVFETGRGPRLTGSEAVGTMAAAEGLTLDTVRLDSGPVQGRVRLYRQGSGLALAFEVRASAPVDALVTGDGATLRVSSLGPRTRVQLPGFDPDTHAVEVSFFVNGHRVGGATLKAGRP